jgi:hypothetical protein
MLLAFLLLITGLVISGVAIYYSVIGLAAIFAAATIPIYIMGGSLEVAKLVCASWLKANWERTPGFMRGYMLTAVVVLMFITSMGIFGFLSKAHTDQNIISGDVISKIAIYDEKIKTEKDNIDAARKALKQMDEAVDQVMARSTTEQGADKAAALRRSQQRERGQLQKDITVAQSNIGKLTAERAPIAAEVRKVEAEVGPIKYIAALIYGDNPDANILEKAVTWVIILIVVVFDPLAVIMLLAAQMTFGWLRAEKSIEDTTKPDAWVADVGEKPTKEEKAEISTEGDSPEKESDIVSTATVTTSILAQHPYLNQPFSHFKNLTPMVHKPDTPVEEPSPNLSISAVVEYVPAPTADSTEHKVNESTFQILPELEEDLKKKTTYMIKQQGQQILKEKKE